MSNKTAPPPPSSSSQKPDDLKDAESTLKCAKWAATIYRNQLEILQDQLRQEEEIIRNANRRIAKITPLIQGTEKKIWDVEEQMDACQRAAGALSTLDKIYGKGGPPT